MFSRTEDLYSSAVAASHFQMGSQAFELTEEGAYPAEVRSSVCVAGSSPRIGFSSYSRSVTGINTADSVLEWSGPTNQETVSLQKCCWYCNTLSVSPEYQLLCLGYIKQDKPQHKPP